MSMNPNGVQDDKLGKEIEAYLKALDAYDAKVKQEEAAAAGAASAVEATTTAASEDTVVIPAVPVAVEESTVIEPTAEEADPNKFIFSESYLDRLADEADAERWALQQEADEEPSMRTGSKTKKKKSTILKKVIISMICVLLVVAIAAGAFIYSKLNLIDTNGDDFLGSDTMENDIDAASIDSITDATGLKDLLKKWATNGGDHMKSKYVKNVLLLGVDSDSKLSDTMMLASINRRTQQISLVSFYRDSYTYIQTKDGKEAYAKLNAAYNYGGADLVVSTIENNYKIDIDDYAMVDYNSFPELIDALGGVTVNVTEKEANYLNETWWRWTRTGKQISFTAGDMKMDGEHALMYSRIRKLDSDVQRTERQRKVITALLDSFKGASVSELNSAVNTLFPNIKTSLSKKEILSYVSAAASEGWLSWNMEQMTMPPDDCCAAGYAGDQWIWICDFEGGAYQLQKLLYGETNITLAEDRVSALDFAQGDTTATTYSSSGSSGSSGQTYSYNTTAYRRSSYNTTASYEGQVEQVVTESYQQETTAAATTASSGWGWGNNSSGDSASE